MKQLIGMFGPDASDEEIAAAIKASVEPDRRGDVAESLRKHGGGSHDDKHHGNWADGSAGNASPSNAPDIADGPSAPPSTPEQSDFKQGDGSRENPFFTDDVDEAAKLFSQGYHVELAQPRQVSTLLDKLSDMVREAEAAGANAPNFDLCKVSVKGTNLFCSEHLGIARENMPQVKGRAVPGSEAEKWVDPNTGEADGTNHFMAHLAAQGVTTEFTQELASHLKASQRELVGAKVAGMASAYREGRFNPSAGNIFISSDGYVVDGHHRWAATVAVDLQDNRAGDLYMNVIRIDMPITAVLLEAAKWAGEFGIAPKNTTTAKRRYTRTTWALQRVAKHQMVSDPDASNLYEENLSAFGGRLNQIVSSSEAALSVPGQKRGSDTMGVHGIWEGNSFVGFTPERAVFQSNLLRQMEADQTLANDALAPSPDRQAIIAIGAPGSGKTTLLTRHLGDRFDTRQFVVIDHDKLTEALLSQGDVAADDLQGMELAALTHAEATALAGAWQHSLQTRGLNLAFDIVGSDTEGTVARIESLKAAGYTVHLIFCDVTETEALASTMRRAATGGRPIPPSTVRGAIPGNLEQIAQAANGQVMWYRNHPTSGQDPELVDEVGVAT